MTRIALVVLLVALAGPAFAGTWVDSATISATAPLSAGHVCYTDGRDIACDSSAPTLSGLGVSSMASLTDVSITSPADNSLLRYNTSSSKWEAVGINDGVSTTTMVSNWPDAIECVVSNPAWGTGPSIFYGQFLPYTPNGLYYYRLNVSASSYDILFNSDGTFNGYNGLTTTDCNTSISNLYAQGRAFNFIGDNGGSSGSTALGDRITSGTLVAVANSATGYISLTTNGTNWGYLSSGASYLPNLSSNLVSATNISATALTVNGVDITGSGASALASLTDVSITSPADNSLLRYVSSTGKWEAVGINNALSTTSVMPNWPDRISCSGSAGYTYFDTYMINGTSFVYRLAGSEGNYAYLTFDTSSGNQTAYVTTGGFDTFMTSCNGKSIAQLYADGQAFNFVGDNGGSSGSTALGDRIVSGTTSMVANSNTSIISITTSGVTTGYFDSVGRLVVPGISITQSYGLSTTVLYLTGYTGLAAPVSASSGGGGGTLTGSGSSGQVTFWNGTSSLTGSSGFTYSGSTLTVTNISATALTVNGVNISGGGSAASPNTGIQYNDNGSVAADANLEWISSSAVVAVSGTVSVTTISATQIQPGSGTGCTMNTIGALRKNPTTGQSQVCLVR